MKFSNPTRQVHLASSQDFSEVHEMELRRVPEGGDLHLQTGDDILICRFGRVRLPLLTMGWVTRG